MKTLIRILLLGTTLGLSLMVFSPAPAQADDYWTNHWNWYDNTYRPYYYRNYSTYGPGYNSYYGPGNYYAPGYYTNPYGSAYGPYYTPYRSYYGTPGVGYGRTYGGGQAVNVGPLTFVWR